MAYGCTVCRGKLAVENIANSRRILTYRCDCGQSYFGPFLPGSSRQADQWLGRKAEIKLGRLVKLTRQAGVIVASDNRRRTLASY